MKRFVNEIRFVMPRWATVAMALVIVWTITGFGFDRGGGGAFASSPGLGTGSGQAAPAVTCADGQCFTDVPPSNTFYTTINALYMDDIISGYACGGPGEPCDTAERPYYRPGNNVNRGQMSKFVDNGRKNISDAIGTSLSISSTAAIAGYFRTFSGGEAVYGQCLTGGNNCYAVLGVAPDGDYAGYFTGGRGVYVNSSDADRSALRASASGTSAYGVEAISSNYRGGYFKSNNSGLYSLYVDTALGPSQGTSGLEVNGSIRAEGNLYIAGSKAGYVVDIMQNVDSASLEPGDVVSIVGNSAPVLGQIPAVTVRKATTGYDTGVVGVVDQVMYVPDAATKAEYDRQQAALRTAMEQRDRLMAGATESSIDAGSKPDSSSIPLPEVTITDEQGVLHAVSDATEVAPGGYMSVVTLGSYKALKLDASFGAVHAGDLLVSSPHAGYAMKATDKMQAFGATIGKALGDLETGTGVVPVMVTLK